MKPCDQCPWTKSTQPGYLGGSSPEKYIGQIVLPHFWLPCHQSKDYQGNDADPNETWDCRGAAIFRANIGVKTIPGILTMPPDDGAECFASPAEFYAHHRQITLDAAKAIITKKKIRWLAHQELKDPGVRQYKRRRRTR